MSEESKPQQPSKPQPRPQPQQPVKVPLRRDSPSPSAPDRGGQGDRIEKGVGRPPIRK